MHPVGRVRALLGLLDPQPTARPAPDYGVAVRLHGIEESEGGNVEGSDTELEEREQNEWSARLFHHRTEGKREAIEQNKDSRGAPMREGVDAKDERGRGARRIEELGALLKIEVPSYQEAE